MLIHLCNLFLPFYSLEIVMKKTLIVGLLGLTYALSGQAATAVSGTFQVGLTLTSSCQITTPANLAMTYTSFQAGISTGYSAFTVNCTNSLPYALSFNNAAGSVVGINYTLGFADNLNAPITGSGLVGTGTTAQTYKVQADMAAGQAGTCNLGSCTGTGANHTVTVTY